MGVDELAAVADAELDGLAHRRLDFDDAALGEPLRADFAAAGWRAARLVWMRHELPPPPGPDLAVEEVPYDDVQELRAAWHEEDFPGQDTDGGYHAQAKEVALRRHVQVLTVRAAGRPVAFAHIERDGDAAEITQVYVASRPPRRRPRHGDDPRGDPRGGRRARPVDRRRRRGPPQGAVRAARLPARADVDGVHPPARTRCTAFGLNRVRYVRGLALRDPVRLPHDSRTRRRRGRHRARGDPGGHRGALQAAQALRALRHALLPHLHAGGRRHARRRRELRGRGLHLARCPRRLLLHPLRAADRGARRRVPGGGRRLRVDEARLGTLRRRRQLRALLAVEPGVAGCCASPRSRRSTPSSATSARPASTCSRSPSSGSACGPRSCRSASASGSRRSAPGRGSRCSPSSRSASSSTRSDTACTRRPFSELLAQLRAVHRLVPLLFFNFVGFELPSAAGDEMKDPQRDVPFTVLRAALVAVALYGVPILAILMVLPAEQITGLGGFIDAMKTVFTVYGGEVTCEGATLTGVGQVLGNLIAAGLHPRAALERHDMAHGLPTAPRPSPATTAPARASLGTSPRATARRSSSTSSAASSRRSSWSSPSSSPAATPRSTSAQCSTSSCCSRRSPTS